MDASMSTMSGVTIAKSSPPFFCFRGLPSPPDGCAAASGSASAAASWALRRRVRA